MPRVRSLVGGSAVASMLLGASVSLPHVGATSSGSAAAATPAGDYYQSIPQATCGPGSMPEDGVQGQVPAADRASGRSQQGYRCNLELVGQSQNEGASWQNAWYGHCDYYDTADNQGQGPTHAGGQQHPGTAVLDVSDPAHPVVTEWLTSPAMLHPWESLKVNEPRGLLAGHLTAGPAFDLYSVAEDCAHPRMVASLPLPNNGHEGEFEPDGMTYWGSSTSEYHAVDVSNPYAPKQLLSWAPPCKCTHGMSFSDDGTRAYFTTLSFQPAATGGQLNGLIIADISDIQLRRPNPQVRVISQVTWPDGTDAQHTIPLTIGGKPYLVFVDETGSGGIATNAGWNYSCSVGLPPYGHARMFDISDEKHPKLVSNLTLQTDDPANCSTVVQDTSGQVIFGYDSHYCYADQRHDATALACGYFNSGIRVFDIRDPYHPKEIAYYNPPAQLGKEGQLPGSEHASGQIGGSALTADWCSSQVRFYHAADGSWQLWAQCQDNGFMVLRFTNDAYPLPPGAVAPSPPQQPSPTAAASLPAVPAPAVPPAQAAAYSASHPGAGTEVIGPQPAVASPPVAAEPSIASLPQSLNAGTSPGWLPYVALLVLVVTGITAAWVRRRAPHAPT